MTSPQLRESPETAKVQVIRAGDCANAIAPNIAISAGMKLYFFEHFLQCNLDDVVGNRRFLSSLRELASTETSTVETIFIYLYLLLRNRYSKNCLHGGFFNNATAPVLCSPATIATNA